jgi:hypothetical protein
VRLVGILLGLVPIVMVSIVGASVALIVVIAVGLLSVRSN